MSVNILMAATNKTFSSMATTVSSNATLTNANKTLYGGAMADHENPWAAWERNFIEQMARLREARQMTQSDLARALKSYGLPFHQPTVQRIEAGERPVRLNEAHLIANVLGVSLDSMTASGAPASRELRYAVDRLRRGSGTVAEELGNSLGEWLEDVGAFALALSDRMNAGTSQPDEVSRWGLAWAQKVLWAYYEIADAWEKLSQIEGAPTRIHGEDDWDVTLPSDDVIDALAQWVDQYGRPEIEAVALAAPNELYAMLPASEMHESPVEVRLETKLKDLDRSIEILTLDLASRPALAADSAPEFSLAWMRTHRARVAAALERISAGTYGVCIDCGEGIPSGRLDATPEAARCVPCQKRLDASSPVKEMPSKQEG